MIRIIAVATVLTLAGCAADQVQSGAAKVNAAATAVQAACADAIPLANAAIAIPTVGPFVAAGVQVGCTGAGVARLASDPSSAAWLGAQSQIMRDALAKMPRSR